MHIGTFVTESSAITSPEKLYSSGNGNIIKGSSPVVNTTFYNALFIRESHLTPSQGDISVTFYATLTCQRKPMILSTKN